MLVSPRVAAGLQTLALPGGDHDLESLKILLHEFAHTRQPMTLNRPTFEGGAEAFAQSHLMEALRRIGINKDDPGNRYGGYAYGPFTDQMFQSGWDAVNRGQFGEAIVVQMRVTVEQVPNRDVLLAELLEIVAATPATTCSWSRSKPRTGHASCAPRAPSTPGTWACGLRSRICSTA